MLRSIQASVASVLLPLCAAPLLAQDAVLPPGVTPEEAFYVKCDSETNPRYFIDAGQVNVQIGICPVKPAEFVIFSIGQWDGGALIEEV